uniref:Uncharacterized protein n=1 Tax=Scleropages formosus TaxID=113540 RepID=A0A8C9RIV6_SCLFO
QVQWIIYLATWVGEGSGLYIDTGRVCEGGRWCFSTQSYDPHRSRGHFESFPSPRVEHTPGPGAAQSSACPSPSTSFRQE